MARQHVQIRYRRSGGLVGIDLTAEASSDELPGEHAARALDLIAAPPRPTTSVPGGADQFSYELHLDDGARQRTFHWSDHEVPDDVRPLLSELNHRAHPAPPA